MQSYWQGVKPPAGAPRPHYPVVAPHPGEVLDLTILSPMVRGTDCHWVIDPVTSKGRSRICRLFQGDCSLCGAHRRLWLGWVAVLNHGKKSRQVLRMGAESAKGLVAYAVQYAGLRGQRVEVTNLHDGTTSRLVFSASPHDPILPTPQAHDVTHSVCLVLGCESLPDTTYSAEDVARLEVA